MNALQKVDVSSSALRLEHVVKTFGDSQALSGVDLEVNRGEVVGLLGPNGAGKSTLLRACEGIEACDGGRILAFGKDLNVEPNALKSKLGLVLQRPRFSAYATVGEIVSLFKALNNPKIPPEHLADALSLADKYDMRISDLSGGQRQRLAVLIGLMWGGELILLDEPTSELDPQARRIVWDLIRSAAKNHGSAILISTHQMEEAQALCDRIYIIDHGNIVASGSPSEVILAFSEEVTFAFTIDVAHVRHARLLIGDFAVDRHGHLAKCRQRVANTRQGQDKLTKLLSTAEFEVHEVALQRSDLEDVFIQITGSNLRG